MSKCTHVECGHTIYHQGHCIDSKCPNSIFRCPVHGKEEEMSKCTHVECGHIIHYKEHCLDFKCPNSAFRCPVHRAVQE